MAQIDTVTPNARINSDGQIEVVIGPQTYAFDRTDVANVAANHQDTLIQGQLLRSFLAAGVDPLTANSDQVETALQVPTEFLTP